MSFFIVKLIFAGVAVALLVVLGLVGRDLWRKRQAGAIAPQPGVPWATEAPQPAKSRLPSLKKKEAEPEPASPAPVRRRQLASFVEAEQDAAEEVTEEAPVIALESAAEPEASAEALPEVIPDEAAGTPEPETHAEAEVADEPAFDTLVLARLEAAFDALQEGDITLDTYAERLREEDAAVEQRIAALGGDHDPAALQAALSARELVRWCLNWVEEQRVQD